MSGRYTLFSDKNDIEELFSVNINDNRYHSSYNIAPGSDNIVILMPRPNVRNADFFRWGLIPSWADDEKVGNKMINTRAETLSEKPSFKKPFKRQRCIVPANGFYEWQTIYNKKIPFYVRTLDQDIFGFAGIYEQWQSLDKSTVINSYTIISTESNTLLQPLHDRMPVILEQKYFESWLDPVNSQTDELMKMLKPYPTERMSIYRVSTDVNDEQRNDPALIQPADV